jgi:hypothetical protein
MGLQQPMDGAHSGLDGICYGISCLTMYSNSQPLLLRGGLGNSVAFGMCTAVTAAHSCTTALKPSTVGLAVCAFGLCLQLHHC